MIEHLTIPDPRTGEAELRQKSDSCCDFRAGSYIFSIDIAESKMSAIS